MAAHLTPAQLRTFLSEGTRTAKIATVRANGLPHIAPVWFILAGTGNDDTFELLFMTGADSVKGRNLRRDPNLAICVDDERPPYTFVSIQGTATLSTDLAEMLPISIRIARRYMGDAQAEQFGRRNAVAGELLVRARPSKIVALGEVAD